MNILAITDNPKEDSLTSAIGKAFLRGASSVGAETDLIDLHRIGFNPTYTLADRMQYLGQGPMPPDVVPLQHEISRADVLAIVFPVYWFSMPATTKGLFDRVLCRGYAFASRSRKHALEGKIVRVFATSGGADDQITDGLRHWVCDAMLRDYCGADGATIRTGPSSRNSSQRWSTSASV